MPGKGRASYNDTTGDWEGLRTAFQEQAELFPNAGEVIDSLTRQLEKVRALKARQESAQADKQRSTQELGDALVEGREIAKSLRRLVKARIEPKNEILVRFGVAPQRKRTRRATAKPPEVVEASKKEVKPEGE